MGLTKCTIVVRLIKHKESLINIIVESVKYNSDIQLNGKFIHFRNMTNNPPDVGKCYFIFEYENCYFIEGAYTTITIYNKYIIN